MIRTDGYYSILIENKKKNSYPVSQFYCLFYKDGSAIYNYKPEYFRDTKDRYFGIYNRGTEWGSYHIREDTIRMLVIESPGGTSWLPTEYILKIENQNSIRLLYVKNPNEPEKGVVMNYLTDEEYGTLAGRFTDEPNLPDPDKSWLKRRKWYWCDKDEFKAWRKGLKDKKHGE